MNFKGMLITVEDMEKSKKFYAELFDLFVEDDFGENVVLTGGQIFLQTFDSWQEFINKKPEEITLCNNASELYFEVDDMDAFIEKLEKYGGIKYVHPLIEHSWGQRAVRFYDPNGHIIEVGENMRAVVKKFIESGMTVAQTAVRMDVQEEYIIKMMD